jgi:ABC transporter substrate binding protein
VIIDHREASGVDQLRAIAVDLVRNKVAVIFGSANALIAAKAETTAIPMVFIGGADPVTAGLVSSFNRPGGNVTGVLYTAGDLPSKQIEILRSEVGDGELGRALRELHKIERRRSQGRTATAPMPDFPETWRRGH